MSVNQHEENSKIKFNEGRENGVVRINFTDLGSHTSPGIKSTECEIMA